MSTIPRPLRCLLLVICTCLPLVAAEGFRLGIQVDQSGSDLDSGVVIADVDAAGFAERIGLRAGDVIVAVADKPVTTVENLQEVLAAIEAEERPKVDIRRGAIAMTLGGMDTPPKEEEEDKADLADLIQALNELPERIDQAASEFKRVYPNGEFDIQINVSIKSNSKAKKPLKLMLGEAASQDDTATASTGDTDSATAEDAAEDTGSAEVTPDDEP